MKRLRVWALRFAGIFAKEQRERDLSAELEAHLRMHIDDNIRAGMTYDEARRQAILRLGGMEATKEAYRDGGTIRFFENVVQDARFAIRQLRKSPAFACIAILTLAAGCSASMALFGFVDAALIKPLPYQQPNQLVHVTETIAIAGPANISYLDYLDWKRLNKVFSSLDVFTGTGYLLTTSAGTEPVTGARVSDGFFHTLGMRPELGRDFYTGEDLAGTPNTAILSYAAWQKRFAGTKSVVGQTIRLSGDLYTVVGVLPRSFQFAARNAEIWTPMHAAGSCDLRRSCHNLEGIARLKDGVSVAAALANITAIAKQLEKQYPGSNRGQGASVLPLAEELPGKVRPILLALLGGGLLLLAIACVNLSSLLLARSESRRLEIAVRSSLGASQTRLLTQFVVEATVLIVAGGGGGLLLASWAMRSVPALIPENMLAGMPYLQGLGLNTHVLAFAGFIGAGAALLFSIIPTLHLRFSGSGAGITEGTRGSSGRGWRRLGANLVMVELAIAMVLLVAGGLLGKSLNLLLHVNLGFQPDHLATLSVAATGNRFEKDAEMVALARRIVDRVSALPGVQSVGLTSVLPVSFNGNTDWIRFVGRPYNGVHNEVNERDVTAAYFKTLRARLVRGRYFTDEEDASKPRVILINEALARKYFPGEDPIGKRVGDGDLSPSSIREIIGVVGDVREGSLDSEIWPAEYMPFNQNPDSFFSLTARTSQSEQSLLPAISKAVRQLDPAIGTIGEASLIDRINASPSAYFHRLSAWLVGGFAVLALLLGVVGLYGVVAYSVSQRTREIGIRMALGAERGNVHRLILREAVWLTVGGLAGGIACSLAAATLVRKLLFGVSFWDISTFAAVAVVLGFSALLASFLPARRAAAVNPIEALRGD